MLVRDIERSLARSEKDGYGFTDMALKRGALIQLCRRLQPQAEPIRVLELGGGQSTLFWHAVAELRFLQLEVFVLEHEDHFIKDLNEKINLRNRIQKEQAEKSYAAKVQSTAPFIRFFSQHLRQISDIERDQIFDQPDHALRSWTDLGQILGPEMNRNYTIRNTFYSDLQQLNLAPESIDVMICDGPHGNGRSLAFPLLAPYMSKQAYILIDDADHYPFQEDAERIFKLRTLYKEHWGIKKWVLLQRTDEEEQ